MNAKHHEHGSAPSGPSQRQLRVGELIRRVLSDALMRGEHHEPALEGVSVTVGEVRCSPDLKVATVYVMPLGGHDAERVLAGLAHAAPELRRRVNREVRLKYSPELRFRLDETFDKMDETRRILSDARVRRDVEKD